jgi:hypothetical protein
MHYSVWSFVSHENSKINKEGIAQGSFKFLATKRETPRSTEGECRDDSRAG